MTHRSKSSHYPYWHFAATLAIVGMFVLTGIRLIGFGSAVSTNPYGYADSCALINNATVIYGWASDPNATSLSDPPVTVVVGNQQATVSTDVSGYRDAPINAYISYYHPGDPEPGTYGFRAQFSGLYKGGQYKISGVILNVGPGSNVPLGINTAGPVDGNTSKPYFAGGVVPSACLGSPPSQTPPPSPPPAPAPTPAPSPTPTPAPTSQPPRHYSPPAATPSSPPSGGSAAPSPGGQADGTVTAGTLAAALNIPTDNASTVQILYGTDPAALSLYSSVTPVTGSATSLTLTGLTADTTYSYVIVRTNAAGQSTTSPVASFSTLGFNLSVLLVRGTAPLSGVTARLGSHQQATSNKQGQLLFKNLPAGSYQLSFVYGGQHYQQKLTLDAKNAKPSDSNSTGAVPLTYTLDVAKLQPVGSGQADAGILVSLAVIALLALGVMAWRLWQRRSTAWQSRSARLTGAYASLPPKRAPPAPIAVSGVPNLPPPATAAPPISHVTPPAPLPGAAHMGESLKEMVLRSMAEEAKKRQAAPPPPPGNPRQP